MSLKIKFLRCFIIASCLCASVAAQERVARVIGGSASAKGGYPFMAALVDNSVSPSDGHFCGGTLIDPEYVLTAAHCAEFALLGLPQGGLSVIIGRNDLTQRDGVVVPAKGVIIHPQYDPYNLHYDVALVKLASPVPFAPAVPISPAVASSIQAGAPLKLLGWGLTDPEFPILPNVLQEAVLPLVSDQECADHIGRWFEPQSMLCAGKYASTATSRDGIDANKGDSGGPLLLTGTSVPLVLGVVSWGLDGDPSRFIGVYSRVAASYDWITSKPPIAPYIREECRPTISADIECAPVESKVVGDLAVGQSLSCVAAGIDGEELVVKRQWYRQFEGDDEPKPIAGARDQTYVPVDDDIDAQILCQVVATNRSGKLISVAQAEGRVGPAAPSTASGPDTSAPIVKRVGVSYGRRGCTVYVSAQDSEPGSGVDTVTGELRSVSHRRGKTKVAVRSIDAANAGGEIWTFDLSGVRLDRERTLVVRASDGAGNSTKRPLRIRIKGS